jgi:hypothetical protein
MGENGRFIEMTGAQLGKLTVLERAGYNGTNALWLCLCECGNRTIASRMDLARKVRPKRSCGRCLRKPIEHHGDWDSVEYSAWRSMINRGKCGQYKEHYWGRGITVCERWKKSYIAFLQDVGRRPSANHSLERIDNNGNYEPENVKWATREEQGVNRRTNRMITYQGETKAASVWAKLLGIKRNTLYGRLRTMSIEEALGKKVGKYTRRRHLV